MTADTPKDRYQKESAFNSQIALAREDAQKQLEERCQAANNYADSVKDKNPELAASLRGAVRILKKESTLGENASWREKLAALHVNETEILFCKELALTTDFQNMPDYLRRFITSASHRTLSYSPIMKQVREVILSAPELADYTHTYRPENAIAA